ncbi:ATP-binding protein [Actinomycetes bacterium KLBMP 9759]
MARTLARQFLVWQLAVVALLLGAVAVVAVVQQDAAFRETEGRRVLSVAEDVASMLAVRQSLERRHFDPLPALATSARNISGADEIVIVDADGIARTAEDPELVGGRYDLGASTALQGRAWTGDPDGRSVVAHVPVMAVETQRLVGVVAASAQAPSLLDGFAAAPVPTVALLGVALVLGVVGSLLLARHVRRQTLGLEPAEIVELVQRREAMLLGVKEGVVGMDRAHRVTLLNQAARDLLGPIDVGADVATAGLDERLRDVLIGASVGEDQLVLRGSTVLVLNRMPVVVHGEQVGAVVTLRDRTELATLEHRLDASRHVTDTLRAQTHEFTNRLHTIAGLTELGEHDEVRRFVADIVAGSDQWRRDVTARVGDAAAAALLIAKASLATERNVELRLLPGTELGAHHDPALSADLVTVVGNLVDNAFDAVATGVAPYWVEIGIEGPAGGAVRVTVRDSGPGVASELAEEVFRHGFTTKAADEPGGRGLGLALARQVCLRRGGSITVHNDSGAVFTAVLPLVDSEVAV